MYTNEHRYFLQFMLKNGCVPIEKAKEFCGKIPDPCLSLQEIIQQVNRKISAHEFRILVVKCELSGRDNVVLVNTSNDQVTKLLGTFTPLELLYFETVLKELLVSDERRIPEAICYNLAKSENVSLKSDHAEELLTKWCEMGYFVHNDNHVYLGCRCIAEFTSYFREYFNDYLTECNLCSELLFFGLTCAHCEKEVHKHCLEKFATKRNICPNCKKQWVEKDPSSSARGQNGIDQSTESESSEEDVSVPGPSNKRRRR